MGKSPRVIPPVYLASQSPRRAELLQQIGVEFKCLATDVDESLQPGEQAAAYVERLAIAKAEAGLALIGQSGLEARPVLGADTSVVLDGEILGKPRDRDHARAILGSLSGRQHQVMTAICVCSTAQQGARNNTAISRTQVRFRPISAWEIDAYCASAEPMDKAGAYGIQGQAAVFVESITGSYSGVVGLPLLETYQLLLGTECNGL